MKIILLKNVPGVGNAGEVKEVASGYGKNYLLPKNLAMLATGGNISLSKKIQSKKARDAEKDLHETERLAEKLRGLNLCINGKINEQGRLYAAITAGTIAQKLKEQGMLVDKKRIELDQPIKEPGEYEVKVGLDHGLEAQIGITVE